MQAEEAPAETIDPAATGGSVTDYPEGYYAVPVEVGDYNENYVQILSGVEEDATVFLRYENAAPANGDTTSADGSGSSDAGGMPDFGDMGSMPNFGGMGGGMPGGMGR